MWLQASVTVCLSCLVLASHGQEAERASLRRSADPRGGRCQYTFTVAAPADGQGCPGDEMESVLSRLVLLEALVSRLAVGGQGGGSTAGPKGDDDGEDDDGDLFHSRVAGERNQLQKDKERLSGQVRELQQRVEQLGAEAEALRQTPCRPDHGPSGSTYHGPPPNEN
ncbi:hypothetical protein NHX12_003874 [Muraenolepis orangiensis]|uniref:Uncharacterized protein n=1 Tax=Muraenolepis orangiensis TaxID=630683 RepID=A0A9Q0IBN7_9TELE|nr:hypothetical protein NHX12_003874 [Muraenolepis orangiensis]